MWAHSSLSIMWLNIGSPYSHRFPLETNGKVVVLGVPILKHFRVYSAQVETVHYLMSQIRLHIFAVCSESPLFA